MNSRDAILATLRSSLKGSSELPRPSLDAEWITYPDVIAQFVAAAAELPATVVEAHGDECDVVQGLALYRESSRVHSFVKGIASKGGTLTEPHSARDLDLAIARGSLGVAESGAIWISGSGLEPRSALFLAQHLVLLLSRRVIVAHLSAAYERIDVTQNAYGAFIAGPSKTADIEQALVIGAHGARSLTIVLYDAGS